MLRISWDEVPRPGRRGAKPMPDARNMPPFHTDLERKLFAGAWLGRGGGIARSHGGEPRLLPLLYSGMPGVNVS